MPDKTVVQLIASTLSAYHNCQKTGNTEWLLKHDRALEAIVKSYMPSGAGIDNGCHLQFNLSRPDRLLFIFGYHHMNEYGSYTRWTEHLVTVKPSFLYGVVLTFSNLHDRYLRDYFYETFSEALLKRLTEGQLTTLTESQLR